MSESTRVGFVGLGAMGSRMAANILRTGRPVIVYNRTASRAEELRKLGADVATSPSEVAEAATIVAGCLLDAAAIETVYLGSDGLLSKSRRGQVYVEHGTFPPELARRIAAAASATGAEFLDAPVTGGPEAATAGSLTMMLGGSAAAVELASPVLAGYAGRICHVGGSGAGLALKLVNQLLVSCHAAAAAEATALLRALAMPVEVAAEVLTSGWAASAMLDRALTRYSEDPAIASPASIGGLLEPQRLADQLATVNGLKLTVFPAAMTLFRRATDAGVGHNDVAALYTAVDLERTP
jgi:3-hydroxyisobutyrate dehydrogenase-like beta-hydroxyacid dehydrogenase